MYRNGILHLIVYCMQVRRLFWVLHRKREQSCMSSKSERGHSSRIVGGRGSIEIELR